MERLDVKTKFPLNVFELDLEVVLSVAKRTVAYSPIPRYPAVERDLAIVVDEAAPAAEISGLIRGYPTEFVEDVTVFDSFQGGNIPDGKKSLGLSIRYRSPERTLTDQEVDELHGEIVGHLKEQTGGEIRA